MKLHRGQKIAAILCLQPAFNLLYLSVTEQFTANPIQDLTLRSGRSAIYLLLLTLLCNPIRRIFKLSAFLPIRKILGIFSAIYALVHFSVFTVLDYQLNWKWISQEFVTKPFLLVGLAALLILVLLLITSFRFFQSRLGKFWANLHKLVYPSAALVIIHIFMTAKGDYLFALQLTTIFILLMIFRIPPFKSWRINHTPTWLQSLNKFLLQ